jgi:hypothetical protein
MAVSDSGTRAVSIIGEDLTITGDVRRRERSISMVTFKATFIAWPYFSARTPTWRAT